jgi:hypothetical protein
VVVVVAPDLGPQEEAPTALGQETPGGVAGEEVDLQIRRRRDTAQQDHQAQRRPESGSERLDLESSHSLHVLADAQGVPRTPDPARCLLDLIPDNGKR